jgi:hypothetical protein
MADGILVGDSGISVNDTGIIVDASGTACCCTAAYRRPRFCDGGDYAAFYMVEGDADTVTGAFSIVGDTATCYYFDFDDDPITDIGGLSELTLEDIVEETDCASCKPCDTTLDCTGADTEYRVIFPTSINWGALDNATCSTNTVYHDLAGTCPTYNSPGGGSLCVGNRTLDGTTTQVYMGTGEGEDFPFCQFWYVGITWSTSPTYGVPNAIWRRWQDGMNITGVYWPYATNMGAFPDQSSPLYVEAILP